jgi:hypothetical protein
VVVTFIGNVYGLLPESAPLRTPLTPLNVMSEALKPVIGALKVNVNCVLVCVREPLAVRLVKVTAISEELITNVPPFKLDALFHPDAAATSNLIV